MAKYSYEERLEAVLRVVEQGLSYQETSTLAAFDAARTAPINPQDIHKSQENFSQNMYYNYLHTETSELASALDEADLPELPQGEFEISVDEVQVLDSAAGIKTEDIELPALYADDFVDEDGNLVPYEREFGEWSDGVDKPIWTSLYSMDIHGEGNYFTYLDFATDEEKVLTMTFFVDEDELDSAFLLFEGPNQEDINNYQYVDIRP